MAFSDRTNPSHSRLNTGTVDVYGNVIRCTEPFDGNGNASSSGGLRACKIPNFNFPPDQQPKSCPDDWTIRGVGDPNQPTGEEWNQGWWHCQKPDNNNNAPVDFSKCDATLQGLLSEMDISGSSDVATQVGSACHNICTFGQCDESRIAPIMNAVQGVVDKFKKIDPSKQQAVGTCM